MDKVVLGLWKKYDVSGRGVLTMEEARNFTQEIA
jgi:hypothetical protein